MADTEIVVLPRSFLYVPAVRPELFAKALHGPSDAVVLDLEDGVAADRKDEARHHVSQWLASGATGQGRPTGVWVRVNADSLEQDLEAIDHPALDGVFLAKCTRESMDRAASFLGGAERAGTTANCIRMIGLIESAAGLLDLAAITGHPLTTTCGLGEADLLADLRITRSHRSAAAIDDLRTRVVVHCAAAGVSAPIAPTSTDFRDLNAFGESSRHLHDLGFRSRTAIHPNQVPLINEAFSPSAEDVSAARDVLARFERAGRGVTTDGSGRLIDAAVVRMARETVERHGF